MLTFGCTRPSERLGRTGFRLHADFHLFSGPPSRISSQALPRGQVREGYSIVPFKRLSLFRSFFLEPSPRNFRPAFAVSPNVPRPPNRIARDQIDGLTLGGSIALDGLTLWILDETSQDHRFVLIGLIILVSRQSGFLWKKR